MDAGLAERRGRVQGYVALLAVQLLFGFFPVVRRWAPEHFTPRAIVAWRILVGGAVLGGIAFAVHGRKALPARSDLGRLFLGALLGIAVNMLLFLEGLDRSTPVNAALIMPVIPVFTYLIATLVRHERFDPVRGVGIAIAFGGTLTLVLQRGPDLSRPHLVGNLLMLANAASYSAFLVLVRPLTRRYPPLVVTAWVFLLAVPTLPFFAWSADWLPAGAGAREWWALVYVLVGATVLAYLLNTFALSKVSASTTAAYIYLQPLVTITTAYLWLGEPVQSGVMLAAALIFGGLALVLRRPSLRPEVASIPAE